MRLHIPNIQLLYIYPHISDIWLGWDAHVRLPIPNIQLLYTYSYIPDIWLGWDAHVKLTFPDIQPLEHFLQLYQQGEEKGVCIFYMIYISLCTWVFSKLTDWPTQNLCRHESFKQNWQIQGGIHFPFCQPLYPF